MQHPENTPAKTTRRLSTRGRWIGGLAAAGAMAALFAVAPLAVANAGEGGHCGMKHAAHHGPGQMGEQMEKMVDRVFSKAGASDEQKKRAQDIVRAASAEMKMLRPAGEDDRDGRKDMLALLSADTIDRDRIEQQRAARHAQAEKMSVVMTRTMADLAEVLTPEQRRAAAKELGRMGEGHHGRHDGRRPPRDDATKG